MMKTEELRAIQKPLKDLYREKPEAALRTMKAEGQLGQNVTISIPTQNAQVEAGLHLAAGGDGSVVCSGDMLLEALVGCAGVTLGAVATAMGLEIRSGTVRVEGDVDFRGTLAVSKEVPVGFQRIRLYFDLDADATQEQLDTLVRLTERYCMVFQTLKQPPEMETAIHRMGSR